MRHIVVAAMATACLSAATALGSTTFYVPSASHPTITAALNDPIRDAGDIIQLGLNYTETSPLQLDNIYPVSVTIRGDPSNPGGYVIQGGASAVLPFGFVATFEGVTLRGNNLYYFISSEMVIKNCVIDTDGAGGAPRFSASDGFFTVIDSTIASTGLSVAGDSHMFQAFDFCAGGMSFQNVIVLGGTRGLAHTVEGTLSLSSCAVSAIDGPYPVIAGFNACVLSIENSTFNGVRAVPVVKSEGQLPFGVTSYVDIQNTTFTNIGDPTGGDDAYPIRIDHSVHNSSTIKSCTFSNNGNASASGNPGVAFVNSPDFLIEDCTFANNESLYGSSALALAGTGSVINCLFEDNRVNEQSTGAVLADGTVAFDDCTFNENVSVFGAGAVRIVGTASFKNCLFDGNSAPGDASIPLALGGGAILVSNSGHASFDACDFANNVASFNGGSTLGTVGGGGAIGVYGGTLTIDNVSTFTNNSSFGNPLLPSSSDGPGGAIAVHAGSVTVRNSAFSTNHAESAGGAIAVVGGTCLLESVWVVNNDAGNVANAGGGVYLAGGVGQIKTSHICDNDPDDISGPWSLDLDTQIACAFVYPGPYSTLQATIDAAADGDTVLVLPGVYNESFTLLGKAITLISQQGAAVTIFDGTGLVTAICAAVNGETSATIVEGFTFRHGTAGWPHTTSIRAGGAVYCFQSSPTFRSCVFEDNAADFGGGAYGSGFSGLFEACVFSNNSASADGGGLELLLGSGKVIDCTFTGNSAGSHGGAMHLVECPATIDGCTVSGNSAGSMGGGISWGFTPPMPSGPAAIVSHCTISNNSAGTDGGGIRSLEGNIPLVLVSNDLCANSPNDVAGPILTVGGNSVCDCPGDSDLNGVVNGADLSSLLGEWGPCASCGSDLDGDGAVGGSDLAVLLGGWGACP